MRTDIYNLFYPTGNTMKSIFIIIILLSISCRESDNGEKEIFLNKSQHKIHVKTEGKGAPIIFAHGGYLDLEMWEPQVKEFKATNKIIRFSDLGHGKTVRAKNSIYGYEIINNVTTQYPDEKFVLVGLSWGAMLCVDFALNYPNKVEKLILVSPGLNGWPYFKDSLAANNYKLRQNAVDDLDTLKAAKLFHQNWVVGPRRQKNELNEAFYLESLDMITRNMRNHWQENWSDLDTIKARTRLEDIMPPTYIIVGEYDAEDILLIAEEYHKRIKNSKKIEIDNVAHLLNMENPARFNEILRDILND